MKPRFREIFLLTAFTLVVISCNKDDDSPIKWLVSTEKTISYSASNINSLVSMAASMYPEILQLQPHLSGGVDVYKVFYKTDIGSKLINASGLVCVPQNAGQYPVICFQNGSNTLDANAPSNSASSFQFQMIEIVASMGYVVIIPDYPGFGASASIPHPYLVKEPTVKSIINLLRATEEAAGNEIKDIEVKNEYYCIGYSQGGWATMAMHYALEKQYQNDFKLKGSACGAGPYDINFLFSNMIGAPTYPMPIYIGYIVNAYSAYNQFTNPVSDILNEPYASRLSSLFNGKNDFNQINAQLTTSVSGLITSAFLTGYATNTKYESVRNAMTSNSISAWRTEKPLYMFHGGSDTQVNPQVTEYFYNRMITAGSTTANVKKEILAGLDHGDASIPGLIKGLVFINNLRLGL
ncbi:MAG: alpha/beta fold hydrolase [Bacteroidales bacterium]|nr:alpha/beta fold hydrolase [Bacteroidales bacterium]MDZ4203613.1 alpha/beta fold hydrolase [Bacteroidales bacterium]